MDREELEQFARRVVEVYLDMEDDMLKNIGKRLAKGQDTIEDIEESGDLERIRDWQRQLEEDSEGLSDINIRAISQHSEKASKRIREMVREAGFKGVDEIENDMMDAYERGALDNKPGPAKESSTLLQIAENIVGNAKDKLNLVNTTMLNQADQAYLDIINRTTSNVLAGTQTPKTALRQVVSDWSSRGVPALVDKGGKHWSTEAYVGMINRTMSNDVANNMQDARMDEYGVDLIEISQHMGARPLCADYQGRIFSRSGNHDKYPALSSTSYGKAAGLFGVNCGHIKYPYFEGMSKQSQNTIDKDKNKQAYENRQKQRYLERQIRHAKREQSMLMEIGDGQGVHFAEEKVRERQKAMRDFMDKTGRTRRYGREQLT
ncbi:phage minor capsid protein [Alkalibacillus sp. S2W]|uniref:phage minor capsid protein n=1 Tax=Alkalibacillus sp. S2W TaxID=3386553 RepID=UPI00398D001B